MNFSKISQNRPEVKQHQREIQLMILQSNPKIKEQRKKTKVLTHALKRMGKRLAKKLFIDVKITACAILQQ
jgi:hypothetical protein